MITFSPLLLFVHISLEEIRIRFQEQNKFQSISVHLLPQKEAVIIFHDI